MGCFVMLWVQLLTEPIDLCTVDSVNRTVRDIQHLMKTCSPVCHCMYSFKSQAQFLLFALKIFFFACKAKHLSTMSVKLKKLAKTSSIFYVESTYVLSVENSSHSGQCVLDYLVNQL